MSRMMRSYGSPSGHALSILPFGHEVDLPALFLEPAAHELPTVGIVLDHQNLHEWSLAGMTMVLSPDPTVA